MIDARYLSRSCRVFRCDCRMSGNPNPYFLHLRVLRASVVFFLSVTSLYSLRSLQILPHFQDAVFREETAEVGEGIDYRIPAND